jgi:hypothetical protein
MAGVRSTSKITRFSTPNKITKYRPDGITGIFHWHNTSGRTMALGSIQPLTEMSARNISWGCVGLTTLPPSCADCLEIWEPQPPGTLKACSGLWWDCFAFFYLFFTFTVKLRLTLEQAMTAQRWNRGIALPVFLPRRYMRVGCQKYSKAALLSYRVVVPTTLSIIT